MLARVTLVLSLGMLSHLAAEESITTRTEQMLAGPVEQMLLIDDYLPHLSKDEMRVLFPSIVTTMRRLQRERTPENTETTLAVLLTLCIDLRKIFPLKETQKASLVELQNEFGDSPSELRLRVPLDELLSLNELVTP
jgi:hypothetical protein